MKSRRDFLFNCAALSAGVMTAPAQVFADSSTKTGSLKNSLNEISPADFSRQINSQFRIMRAGGVSICVRLDEVRIQPRCEVAPGKRPPMDANHEKFALVFAGRRSELIEENTYIFEHPQLGRFEMFITPIWTRHPEKIDYEAAINRVRNNSSNA